MMSRLTADRLPRDTSGADAEPASLVLPRGLAACTIQFAHLPTLANCSFAGRGSSVVVDEHDARLTVDDRRRTPFVHSARRRITLSADRAWRIECRRGLADVAIDARCPALGALVLTGGVTALSLRLGELVQPVELRFGSGASDIALRRAAGVPLSVRLLGAHTDVQVDGRAYSGTGSGDPILVGDPAAAPGVEVTFESAAARVAIDQERAS